MPYTTNDTEWWPVWKPINTGYDYGDNITPELVERYNNSVRQFWEVQQLLGNDKDWEHFLSED